MFQRATQKLIAYEMSEFCLGYLDIAPWRLKFRSASCQVLRGSLPHHANAQGRRAFVRWHTKLGSCVSKEGCHCIAFEQTWWIYVQLIFVGAYSMTLIRITVATAVCIMDRQR